MSIDFETDWGEAPCVVSGVPGADGGGFVGVFSWSPIPFCCQFTSLAGFSWSGGCALLGEGKQVGPQVFPVCGVESQQPPEEEVVAALGLICPNAARFAFALSEERFQL